MFRTLPDIRNTILEEHIVDLAENKIGSLSAQQKILWDDFFAIYNSDNILQKKDIDPILLKQFLPNLWMADLIFDESGALKDVEVRLMGTKVASIFGERTGNHVLSEKHPNAFAQELNVSTQQVIDVANLLLHEKRPVVSLETRLSPTSKEKLNATALMFAVRNNSEHINMVLGHTEVEITERTAIVI